MNICYYFLLFIIYSFFGWLIEVTCKLIQNHRFINRGFLIGPYCPIYGWGCLAIILTLSRYSNDPIVLFFMAIVICSILEYVTSYLMEIIFKTRWWDYSNKKFNINGRICLETMIPFGILGCLLIYFINPTISRVVLMMPSNIINVLAIIIFIIYLIDNIISFKIIFNLKGIVKNIKVDSTEEITKKVKEILFKRNIFHRRLVNAFPNMQASINKFKKRIGK